MLVVVGRQRHLFETGHLFTIQGGTEANKSAGLHKKYSIKIEQKTLIINDISVWNEVKNPIIGQISTQKTAPFA